MTTKHQYIGLAMCPRCHGSTFYVGTSLVLCATMGCDFSVIRADTSILAVCECEEGRHIRPYWQKAYPYEQAILDA